MTFNINPQCPEGSLTRITWQFPGQPQKSSQNGDDYQFCLSLGNQSLPRKRYILYCRVRSLYNSQTDSPSCTSPGEILGVLRLSTSLGYFAHSLSSDLINDFAIAVVQGGGVRSFTYSWFSYKSQYSNLIQVNATYVGVPGSGDYSYCRLVQDGIIEAWISPEGNPNEKLQLLHQINILKSGVVIESDYGSDLPSVSYECLLGCPPGTCQVDCGSVYCCYGSDGIAVSSFNK